MDEGVALLPLSSATALHCYDFQTVEAQTEAEKASIKLKSAWAEKQYHP